MKLNFEKYHGNFMTLVGATLIFAAGCSSAPSRQIEVPAGNLTSEIEISYNRGHDVHRFLISEKSGQVVATSFLDHQVVKTKKISPEKYHEFRNHLGEFVAVECKTVRNPAANGSSCRSHYSISIRVAEEARQKSGCRSSDDQSSRLGQLLLEADFLIAGKST